MESDGVKIIVALIAAVASVIVAVLSAVAGWLSTGKAQRQAAENQRESARLSEELEKLKAELGQSAAERKARLDYEYEARKRLYEEYEPLRFQLLEAAEGAYHRVQSLARTARIGCLEPGSGWLWQPGYYLVSTVYKLLLPIAIFKLIQRKLTVIDLSVSSQIGAEYRIAKALYISWTDDFEFARLQPSLEYAPAWDFSKNQGNVNPATIRKQGVPMGYLDNALDALIVVETGGLRRCRSFGEFELALRTDESARQAFSMFIDGLVDFHPRHCPVLWRMLVTQAQMYRLLLNLRNLGSEDERSRAAADNHLFDWRQKHETYSDAEALINPLAVAREYIAGHDLMTRELVPITLASSASASSR